MGGILSFGQTAFFGLAGYSFAIISINFADTFAVGIWAPIIALLITAIFGAIVGYFLFYGGIYDVFIGIVTLAITLVLETFMAQTAGPEWAIGNARLNGFNGMQGMPPIGIKISDSKFYLNGAGQYYFMVFLAMFLLWILYKIKKSKLIVMKVLKSLKSAKTRDKNCRIVKRKGRTLVINKINKRFKAKQA